MSAQPPFQGVSFSLAGGARRAGMLVGADVLDIEDALTALSIPDGCVGCRRVRQRVPPFDHRCHRGR
jgi:hypothetical protein